MMKLNKGLYNESIIKQAIRDYRSIALIELSEDHSFYYLQFNECKYDEERTVREFENYLIDLTNVEHAK